MHSATDTHLDTLGVIPLYVTLGSFQRHIRFSVVDALLSPGILLGPLYIMLVQMIWTFVSDINFEKRLIRPKDPR